MRHIVFGSIVSRFKRVITIAYMYYRYNGTFIGNAFGPGTGEIWFDDVQCVGNETSIADCVHNGWNVTDCDHDEDVSVLCGKSSEQIGNFWLVTYLPRSQPYISIFV